MGVDIVLKRRIFAVVNAKSTRASDRFCGFTDPPLSDAGVQSVLELRQAQAQTGRRSPKIWYVSDRRRTQETFELMTAGMHAPVVRITDRLREMNFGDFENLTWDELPDDFQRHYESCQNEPMGLVFPGGETFKELCSRVSSLALEVLSYDRDDADIGIIGHQGSIRLWQLMSQEKSPSEFFNSTPENATAEWLDISAIRVANWRRKYLEPPA